ncbi:unnamed protein product [Pieris macdunnoughi]|uniref:Uncharacterized protein n=1 Tax=Pieris macdunnoughi TaxID=345717 RepID=A0A821TBG4_9NEOP|nr:unnamed protein product [Pieris macdunnoughi]
MSAAGGIGAQHMLRNVRGEGPGGRETRDGVSTPAYHTHTGAHQHDLGASFLIEAIFERARCTLPERRLLFNAVAMMAATATSIRPNSLQGYNYQSNR